MKIHSTIFDSFSFRQISCNAQNMTSQISELIIDRFNVDIYQNEMKKAKDTTMSKQFRNHIEK